VGADAEVLMTGTVDYQPSASELPATLEDAPLLVRFHTGSTGQVLFSTFALNVQTTGIVNSILLEGIDGLFVGAGSESDTGTTATGEGTDAP
jgi:hypothetical protein